MYGQIIGHTSNTEALLNSFAAQFGFDGMDLPMFDAPYFIPEVVQMQRHAAQEYGLGMDDPGVREEFRGMARKQGIPMSSLSGGNNAYSPLG